jgi:hypothetical protein
MPREGDIVIVWDLLDPNGVNPKDRPCVVVTRNEDLDAGAPIDSIPLSVSRNL